MSGISRSQTVAGDDHAPDPGSTDVPTLADSDDVLVWLILILDWCGTDLPLPLRFNFCSLLLLCVNQSPFSSFPASDFVFYDIGIVGAPLTLMRRIHEI